MITMIKKTLPIFICHLEIGFQDVELSSTFRPKLKKQKHENRTSRRMSSHMNLYSDFIPNYYSFLKNIRLQKILGEHKAGSGMLNRRKTVVSLVPIRGIMGLAPYNSKPPIREPNMPKPRDKKNEKDEKKKKKPVIHVDEKSAAELEMNNNLWNIEDEHYRYKWGVKLGEEPSVAETFGKEPISPQYVTKQSWGVNMTKLVTNIDEIIKAEEVSTEKSFKAEDIFKHSAQTAQESKNSEISDEKENFSLQRNKTKLPEKETGVLMSKKESDSTFTHVKPSSETPDVNLAQTTKRDEDMKNKSQEQILGINQTSTSEEESTVDSDYNIPGEISFNEEIAAWQNVAEKSKIPVVDANENITGHPDFEDVFIRPEPPEPKLDVEKVKSIDPISENKEKPLETLEYKVTRAIDFKNESKSIDHALSKKIHTDSRLFIAPTSKSSTDSIIFTEKNCADITLMFPDLNAATHTSISKDEDNRFITQKPIFEPENLVETSNKTELLEHKMTHALLPTKVLTPTKVNYDDMSCYNAQMAKEIDKIYGRELEISLSSPDGIAENVLDAPLPTKIEISVIPRSKKKEDGVDWIPLLCSSNSEDTSDFYSRNIFDGGFSDDSSGYRGPKTKETLIQSNDSEEKDQESFLKTQDNDKDDESEDYVVEGDYIRVPGDPYPYSREHFNTWRIPRSPEIPFKQNADDQPKVDPSQHQDSFASNERLNMGYDKYAFHESADDHKLASAEANMEEEMTEQTSKEYYFDEKSKMTRETEALEKEVVNEAEAFDEENKTRDVKMLEETKVEMNPEIYESVRPGGIELSGNAELNEKTDLAKYSEISKNIEVAKNAEPDRLKLNAGEKMNENTSSIATDLKPLDSELTKSAYGKQAKNPVSV